jgi:tetratricopeptide (TPR) repeat protein
MRRQQVLIVLKHKPGQKRKMHRAATIAILCLCACVSSFADTIVLKNGQRIVASNITQDAEHVSYETPAGKMTIPKSIVARIEHDDLNYSPADAPTFQTELPAEATAPVRGYEEIARLTVHDDSIDFAYIAKLENEARSGSATASARAAAAHYFAARFLTTKGDGEAAIDHYRQALLFTPNDLGMLLNLAVLYLRESQFTSALDPLEHARRVTPDSSPAAAAIAKLMGWAYYGSNKIDLAIEEWKRSEQLHPDPEVEQAIEKAERDKSEEESYREGETAHFALKYYGGAAPALAREILRALEDDFSDLQSQLDYTPPDQISVILYTEQAFADITQAPGWVGALNDGRLRIPVQGLTGVSPELAHVLKHELTHSFITQKSHGRAPTWLQEGVAQYMEGKRCSWAAGALVASVTDGSAPSLASLEISWMSLPSNLVSFAYPWSLAVVESIVQNGGVTDISRLLDRIAAGLSMEAALREVLHCDYADLEQQTVVYLKHEYLR